MENHSLTVDHYHVSNIDSLFQQKVKLKLHQQTYRVRINLLNSTFQRLKNDIAMSSDFRGGSRVWKEGGHLAEKQLKTKKTC